MRHYETTPQQKLSSSRISTNTHPQAHKRHFFDGGDVMGKIDATTTVEAIQRKLRNNLDTKGIAHKCASCSRDRWFQNCFVNSWHGIAAVTGPFRMTFFIKQSLSFSKKRVTPMQMPPQKTCHINHFCHDSSRRTRENGWDGIGSIAPHIISLKTERFLVTNTCSKQGHLYPRLVISKYIPLINIEQKLKERGWIHLTNTDAFLAPKVLMKCANATYWMSTKRKSYRVNCAKNLHF